MFTCFADSVPVQDMDRQPFKFGHRLLGHPALELKTLGEVIPALPAENVMYSRGLLRNGDDFEGTFKERPHDVSIAETIERIRTSDSYIMVASPEVHTAFKDVYRALLSDVDTLIERRSPGGNASGAQLYLFIASPNSVTPFHIDRYSTLLMQFRGSKQLTVFPQWDEQVVAAPDREAYVAYAKTKLPWSREVDARGTTFDFAPGEALHIPFIAGHHVLNGSEDVSISMSIIFNTPETVRWRDALAFNHLARKALGNTGYTPSAVANSAWKDTLKRHAFRAARRVQSIARRGH